MAIQETVKLKENCNHGTSHVTYTLEKIRTSADLQYEVRQLTTSRENGLVLLLKNP